MLKKKSGITQSEIPEIDYNTGTEEEAKIAELKRKKKLYIISSKKKQSLKTKLLRLITVAGIINSKVMHELIHNITVEFQITIIYNENIRVNDKNAESTNSLGKSLSYEGKDNRPLRVIV